MDLERIWDRIGDFFNALTRGIEQYITSIFGSSNARYVKKLQPRVDAINALEPAVKISGEKTHRRTTPGENR